MAGDPQSFFPQVGRCGCPVREHLHYVLRFQKRANAGADRLPAIGYHDIRLQSEPVAQELEQFPQAHCLIGIVHLGMWPDRNVDK